MFNDFYVKKEKSGEQIKNGVASYGGKGTFRQYGVHY